MYSNIYYFRNINRIGGIETFFYQLAKKYSDLDLVIVYKNADYTQLNRLSKYVRCVKYTGQKIECKKAFFNFNLDIIDNVQAEEYCLVVHGDYKMLKAPPPYHEKLTKVYGVSQIACDSYTELTGKKCELVYNPISLEDNNKLVKLVSATRLNDKVKGYNRILELANALDNYAQNHGITYEWQIFSDKNERISKNVVVREPRLDIQPFIEDADYVVQLSDDFEGYNYTVNESLYVGTPVVITPCKVYKELGIDDTMSIRLNFNLSNIDEVVEKIFENAGKFKFKYIPPDDGWNKLLVKSKSTYKKELENMVRIRVTRRTGYTDTQLGRHVNFGEEYLVMPDRAKEIVDAKYAEIVTSEEKTTKVEQKPYKLEEKSETCDEKEPKVEEKPKRKTTKKAKKE